MILEEVGRQVGVTRERVRQVTDEALEALKPILEKYGIQDML